LEEFRKKLRMTKELDEKVSHKEFGSSDVISLYEICFKEYGWGYEELMDMPIPVFMQTIEALKERKEKEKPRKK
jgi:hypothetical protein